MRYTLFGSFLITLVFLNSCSESGSTDNSSETNVEKKAEPLIHSFAQPSEAVIKHLNWNANVDFNKKVIEATAHYSIETAEDADRLILDIKNIDVAEVKVDSVVSKEWWLGPKDPLLGQALEIAIKPSTKLVTVQYRTSPDADALQWLSPQQTADKQTPFLFTQSQAILARTWIPCQDSPGVRYTYNATVTVPSGLLALMSASNPQHVDSSGVYNFEMNQPIPSYLMALAVGHLAFKAIGPSTGVYAEPSVVEAAAFEFEDMQKMLESAEVLYGDYKWERYDVLVLPPSFPFGGMENPRLTFATPTILAGDKSLTSLVAHELAHSWSGNLVTNHTWNDFWLNEGFTVYFERRIMEAVYGEAYAEMLQELGRQDLEKTLSNLSNQPSDTKLKLDLEGRDPDDGMTDIAYEKGNAFLMMLEKNVGREALDAFLNDHFNENAFETITTEAFLKNMKNDLLSGNQEKYNELMIDQWVYEPGLPANAVEVSSELFDQVEEQRNAWLSGKPSSQIDTAGWTTHQWLHFLRGLPDDLSEVQMKSLDKAFGFTKTGNSEIAAEWYVLALNTGYQNADEAIKNFLVEVGRRKFLTPIYSAMIENDSNLERAREIYKIARPNYHSVSTHTLDALLQM